MNPWWALAVPAYLLGTFPTAILVGRREGRDPTSEGSGNPGASNTLRTMGRRAGALVLLGDAGKGALAAGAGWVLGGRGIGVACGLLAVVGHVFPATRGLRGGKGVATGAGMALVLLPVAALGLGVLWGVVVKVTGAASAGRLRRSSPWRSARPSCCCATAGTSNACDAARRRHCARRASGRTGPDTPCS